MIQGHAHKGRTEQHTSDGKLSSSSTQPKHWAEPPLLKSLLLGIYTNVVNGIYIGKHQPASWLRGLVACEQAPLFGQAKADKTLLDLHISS